MHPENGDKSNLLIVLRNRCKPNILRLLKHGLVLKKKQKISYGICKLICLLSQYFYIWFILTKYSYRGLVCWHRKGKGHPRPGHEGPEGEQRYSSTLPSTSALDGGWVVNATPRPLYPRERETVPIVKEAGWVWTGAENLAPHRDSIPGPSSP